MTIDQRINRLLTVAYPLAMAGGFVLMFKNPLLLPVVAPVLHLGLLMVLWQLAGRRWHSRLAHFMLTPLVLLSSLTVYVAFLQLGRLRVVLSLISSWLIYVYLENVHTYYSRPERYQSYVWINLATYLNVVAIFFLAGGWYWLHLFVNVPLLAGSAVIAVVAGALGSQQMALGSGSGRGWWPLALAVSVSMGELFYVLGWLPTTPFFNATVLMLAYYVQMGLSRNYLLGTLYPRVVRRYAVISVICLLLVAVTARWV